MKTSIWLKSSGYDTIFIQVRLFVDCYNQMLPILARLAHASTMFACAIQSATYFTEADRSDLKFSSPEISFPLITISWEFGLSFHSGQRKPWGRRSWPWDSIKHNQCWLDSDAWSSKQQPILARQIISCRTSCIHTYIHSTHRRSEAGWVQTRLSQGVCILECWKLVEKGSQLSSIPHTHSHTHFTHHWHITACALTSNLLWAIAVKEHICSITPNQVRPLTA